MRHCVCVIDPEDDAFYSAGVGVDHPESEVDCKVCPTNLMLAAADVTYVLNEDWVGYDAGKESYEYYG